VRIIAATNKDLAEEIKAGRFRQDLFYRLNVVPIQIPPLRERKEDTEALVGFFVEEISEKTGKPAKLTPNAIHALKNRGWPGNVRELRNFIERLLILTNKPDIDAEDVLKLSYPEEANIESQYENLDLKESKRTFERNLIINRLIKFNNNITKTAESLDIERTYLHKKIKELGIDSEITVSE
jgi:two-component system, NtrC family, nitrogen regulation response regulator NtrX